MLPSDLKTGPRHRASDMQAVVFRGISDTAELHPELHRCGLQNFWLLPSDLIYVLIGTVIVML